MLVRVVAMIPGLLLWVTLQDAGFALSLQLWCRALRHGLSTLSSGCVLVGGDHMGVES